MTKPATPLDLEACPDHNYDETCERCAQPKPQEAPGEEYVVWSKTGGGLYWRANRCGYTSDVNQAGRYSREEAEAICRIRKIEGTDIPAEEMRPAPAFTLLIPRDLYERTVKAMEKAEEFLRHSGNQRAVLSGKFATPSGRYEWFKQSGDSLRAALDALRALDVKGGDRG